jgi:FlaA1/EpsC-like NDP-sugar epimerase
MLNAIQRTLRIVLLLATVIVSFACALLLRFEFAVPHSQYYIFQIALCVFVIVKMPVFWASRMHLGSWRTASLFDLHRIALANVTASGLTALITAVIVGAQFPRSVYIIDGGLCFLLTAGVIFSVRLYSEVFLIAPREAETKRILIYGAGSAGFMLGREIHSNSRLRTTIVGFLDDDVNKRNSSLLGVGILGTGFDAKRIVESLARARKPISEIIIAMPSASGKQMQAVTAHCRAAGTPFKTLPSVAELLDGKMTRQIREVSANDLLGREAVHIDGSKIAAAIAGQSVLVTGGCGSIGSELCRQLAQYGPSKLVIFDQAESEMFMLGIDLRKRHPQLNLVTEIGDIYRASRVQQVMTRHGINVVFHAAAYKHVPLMEDNIVEAVENNVIGTYNVARAAHRNGVKKFVLISSDKAVNPTSIMGLTKRVAELIVSAMPLDGSRKSGGGAFLSVRFGNVLGSSGSVIPIFQQQIAAGGPVTVTHPEMRRYFMSIAEAVQLVLQASTMGEGSEVFVLDMGEPVPIMNLARNMIHLAGLVEGQDIEITVTGLRPGEKLFEEVRLDGENILPTYHEKIRRFRGEVPSSDSLMAWLESLRILLAAGNSQAVKAHMARLVPEYQGQVSDTDNQQQDDLKAVAQLS